MTREFSEHPSAAPHDALAVPPPSSFSPSRPGRLRRTLLVAAIGLFGAAAALGMVRQPDYGALPPPVHIESVLPLPAAAIELSASDAAPYINETRIRPGDTLSAVLQRLSLDEPGLQAFLTRDPSARSIYKLYPGRAIQAATDADGRLQWLRYVHTPGISVDGQTVTKMLYITPQGESYAAREQTQRTDSQTRVAVGTITSSLFAATDAADIPDAITLQMASILNSKIDFIRDLRKGDQFRVVYDTRSYNGRYVGAGRVLALEFVNQGKTYNAVWFSPEPDDSKGAYYDFDGTNLRGTFLRAALEFSRVSSTFGMRMHPIHRQWTGHKGVDYAARTGTPIHSTADGVIEFAGVQHGYGNVIIVRHSDTYSTLYAHQSRLADGMHKGVKVSQGEVIGYVGRTGWATGPHLHYELRINGQPVDPLSVDLPIARTMDAKETQKFAQAVAPLKAQIQMLTALQNLPDDVKPVASVARR